MRSVEGCAALRPAAKMLGRYADDDSVSRAGGAGWALVAGQCRHYFVAITARRHSRRMSLSFAAHVIRTGIPPDTATRRMLLLSRHAAASSSLQNTTRKNILFHASAHDARYAPPAAAFSQLSWQSAKRASRRPRRAPSRCSTPLDGAAIEA